LIDIKKNHLPPILKKLSKNTFLKDTIELKNITFITL